MQSNLKELSNTLFNQAKVFTDSIKETTESFINNPSDTNNVIDFQKKVIRQNPLNSQLITWYISQIRHSYVAWVTLPHVISEHYWSTWSSVFTPEGRK